MILDIAEVKRYLSAHIAEIHAIQDVADHFGTSLNALRIRWKRSREQDSLARFIRDVRTEIMINTDCGTR